VECISKGKAHKRYGFGVKASIAIINKGNFLVGGSLFFGTDVPPPHIYNISSQFNHWLRGGWLKDYQMCGNGSILCPNWIMI